MQMYSKCINMFALSFYQLLLKDLATKNLHSRRMTYFIDYMRKNKKDLLKENSGFGIFRNSVSFPCFNFFDSSADTTKYLTLIATNKALLMT